MGSVEAVKGFQRVLVPLDFSASSARRLDLAAGLVAPEGALRLLHVVEWVPSVVEGAFVGYANPKDVRAVHAESEQKLRGLAAAAGTQRVAVEVIEGDAAEAILEVAERERADLIVIGTHARKGLGHLLLGSVAEKIVRRSPCPVLTVRG